MSEQVNHEAAKVQAELFAKNPQGYFTWETVNYGLAYLDLDAKLTAERQRVDRLAELVEEAFLLAYDIGDFDARYNIDVTKETHWSVSEIRDELDTIMEGRDNG